MVTPRYYYHLQFDLYPTPNPESEGPSKERAGGIWLPPPGASAFDRLPSHPTRERAIRDDRRERGGEAREERGLGRERELQSESRSVDESRILQPSVIDCGSRRSDEEPRRRRRTLSSPTAATQTATIRDWRFGRVSIDTADPITMSPTETGKAAPPLGPSFGGASATKAEWLPLDTKHTELGWGVVRFYRDGDEVPTSADDDDESGDGDCCVLCIPAVPAYMSPGDFMGFVGDRWMGDISHCRMVMTSSMNRYLVLLRFREGERARLWKREFDGKVFNSIESRVCHVVMVKSITFSRNHHPVATAPSSSSSSAAVVSSSLKPFPPPTPNLIELPTCPVCLERMDETNGLMTIPCSHVFHCNCLQNWRGAGCPVCRFTNASSQAGAGVGDDGDDPNSRSFGAPVSNLCSVCDCADDLWICLICGHVGCGRYKGGHAKDHWKDTAHCFALELETQHVWDYAGDVWVHRLIRDKGDGKVVELPGRGSPHDGQQQQQQHEDQDVVPRAKLENIGLEYTHLITSQLESQRAYYEDMISKAADKAAASAASAEASAAQTVHLTARLSLLEERHEALQTTTLPQLERDVERQRSKAERAEKLARDLSRSLQEEKKKGEEGEEEMREEEIVL
ncbi:hypothetical protein CDD80_6556 [Ophiocordyceps camponoti-rufipedis]|uniref:RING-type domain-containing protein n=1 Tax=Ophiocordyceps camponoti-rufipedis TaxID=2004952 RepID=A0A2C5YRQ8_9HYPO|nr:hypothetical protein CDD80_6556 [Ophiocordyceps camponoti-rufipedis]